MDVILIIAGFLIGHAVTILIMLGVAKKRHVGKLKLAWDQEEHQPYMFMELAKPDITEVTRRNYVVLSVDNEIKFSQK